MTASNPLSCPCLHSAPCPGDSVALTAIMPAGLAAVIPTLGHALITNSRNSYTNNKIWFGRTRLTCWIQSSSRAFCPELVAVLCELSICQMTFVLQYHSPGELLVAGMKDAILAQDTGRLVCSGLGQPSSPPYRSSNPRSRGCLGQARGYGREAPG